MLMICPGCYSTSSLRQSQAATRKEPPCQISRSTAKLRMAIIIIHNRYGTRNCKCTRFVAISTKQWASFHYIHPHVLCELCLLSSVLVHTMSIALLTICSILPDLKAFFCTLSRSTTPPSACLSSLRSWYLDSSVVACRHHSLLLTKENSAHA